MNIRFAADDDIPAVVRFNQRLREGGRGEEQITLRLSLPGEARYRPAGFPVYRRMMIAEDGREVRSCFTITTYLFTAGSGIFVGWTCLFPKE
jgi:hypothetical protein